MEIIKISFEEKSEVIHVKHIKQSKYPVKLFVVLFVVLAKVQELIEDQHSTEQLLPGWGFYSPLNIFFIPRDCLSPLESVINILLCQPGESLLLRCFFGQG